MQINLTQPYWLERLQRFQPPPALAAHTDRPWAIYTRFSTEEQARGYSEAEQIRECRRFAEAQAWPIAGIYSDQAHTGTNDRRPALQHLLAAARQGQIGGVITHKIDRIYRNLKLLLNTLELWQQQGVRYVSVTEGADPTTHSGRLLLVIMATIAENFVDNLREETKKGKRGRYHAGLHNGPLPYGYCAGRCSACTDANGPGYCYRAGLTDLADGPVAVPHPIDSQAVRRAFEWYLQGDLSDRAIAQALNDLRIPAPDGTPVPVRSRGKPGQPPAPFTKSMVRDLLQNQFYIGQVAYYGSTYTGHQVIKHTSTHDFRPGRHLPLIAESDFNQAGRVRDLKGRAPQGEQQQRRASRVYVLQGLLDCGGCGGRLHSQSGGATGQRRHLCKTRLERGDCPQPSVKADRLEGDLAVQISRLKLPDGWIEQTLGYLINEAGLAAIIAQRALLQRHFDEVQRLYEAEEISRQQYRREWLAYERGLADLRLDDRTDLDLELARELLSDLGCLWPQLTPLEQKSITQAILRVAIVDKQHVIEWHWYRPFTPLFQ